jgi:8-oxo-dGTP pyrophosphatase MutT (NUDIX family)
VDGPDGTRVTEVFPVPDWLAEHARTFYATGGRPQPPRRAGTVVLMRSADIGFEVYAIRRAPTMAFAADVYAFPGGAVDPRDAAVEPAWAGPTPEQWATRLGLDEADARAVVCAAIREVFEETGVLLAGPDPSTVVGEVSGPDWEASRVAVETRQIGFAELLAARSLILRSDLLAPWARWLTPEFEPRRYDTYFFLAQLPERQVPRDVGGEAAHAVWGTPAELADPRHVMLPPTRLTLRQLAGYPNVAAALDASAGRDVASVIMPRIELGRDGVGRLIVPA